MYLRHIARMRDAELLTKLYCLRQMGKKDYRSTVDSPSVTD
ncbi:hypothetical protein [Echinicola soli]|nr:hypothetical protein [Echinicola soli]